MSSYLGRHKWSHDVYDWNMWKKEPSGVNYGIQISNTVNECIIAHAHITAHPQTGNLIFFLSLFMFCIRAHSQTLKNLKLTANGRLCHGGHLQQWYMCVSLSLSKKHWKNILLFTYAWWGILETKIDETVSKVNSIQYLGSIWGDVLQDKYMCMLYCCLSQCTHHHSDMENFHTTVAMLYSLCILMLQLFALQ